MKYISLALLLLLASLTLAQPKAVCTASRATLLGELKKCAPPRPANHCDESSVYRVAELYQRGDVSVLARLMDVAPHSDGALSEALGDFFSQLLCNKPETFLRAVATRPVTEHANLLLLAAVADGGGMGCGKLTALRRRLKAIAQRPNDHLALLAKVCLTQVNQHNPDR